MFDNFTVPPELIPSDPRFGCGPSLVPVEFMEKLAKTGAHLLGTSHRKEAVKNVVKEAQDGLRKFFNVPEDYSIVLGNGGATFLFDMIGLGMVEKKITHYTCGEFSSKWFKSSDLIPWIEAKEVSTDYGKGINGEAAADSDMIAVTLNETSTGVQLSKLPTVDANTILAVDATSGAGQVPIDVSKTDLFFFSPQKVFASEGGLFVAIMSPKARERALKLAQDKSRYIPGIMNWKTAIDNSDKNQTYNTPAIATIFFLAEQVKMMNEQGGYDYAQKYAKEKADFIYNWATQKEYLSPFVDETEFRSSAVACIDVDEKYPVNDLLKKLHNDKIVYGIESYRKLGRNQFRISLFHNVSLENLKKLTEIIDLAFKS